MSFKYMLWIVTALASVSITSCARPEINTPPKQESTESDSAVVRALKWLARHQNPDGSWGAANHTNQCVGAKCDGAGDSEYDAGVTALALLAFLGAGYSHLSKDAIPDPVTPGKTLRFGEVVKSGLKWLMSKQDPEGCIGGRGTKYMYNHSIATLALSEAYGMSATHLFKGPTQKAIDFIIAAQNPGRAWRYTMQSGDNDTSVTGWAIMAVKSAELSELDVPAREAYKGARTWFDEVTDSTIYYRAGYNSKFSGKVFVPGKNENFVHHETMTAVGVLCRILMSKDKGDPALAGVQLLVSDLPKFKTDWTDYYYWHFGSLALFKYEGPDGPYWKKWDEAIKSALVPNQKSGADGCSNGSWTSEDDRWGFEGGRVYAVAINALTLEMYYRFPTPLIAPRK
jgi:squalene cyclase